MTLNMALADNRLLAISVWLQWPHSAFTTIQYYSQLTEPTSCKHTAQQIWAKEVVKRISTMSQQTRSY